MRATFFAAMPAFVLGLFMYGTNIRETVNFQSNAGEGSATLFVDFRDMYKNLPSGYNDQAIDSAAKHFGEEAGRIEGVSSASGTYDKAHRELTYSFHFANVDALNKVLKGFEPEGNTTDKLYDFTDKTVTRSSGPLFCPSSKEAEPVSRFGYHSYTLKIGLPRPIKKFSIDNPLAFGKENYIQYEADMERVRDSSGVLHAAIKYRLY